MVNTLNQLYKIKFGYNMVNILMLFSNLNLKFILITYIIKVNVKGQYILLKYNFNFN